MVKQTGKARPSRDRRLLHNHCDNIANLCSHRLHAKGGRAYPATFHELGFCCASTRGSHPGTSGKPASGVRSRTPYPKCFSGHASGRLAPLPSPGSDGGDPRFPVVRLFLQ